MSMAEKNDGRETDTTVVKSGGVSRQGDALEWATLSGQTIEKKSEELSCELPVQMARCVDRDACRAIFRFPTSDVI